MGFSGISRDFQKISQGLPGLVNIQKTIEHGPVEIVDLAIKHGGFFHLFCMFIIGFYEI
jgi:hypothetical protein